VSTSASGGVTPGPPLHSTLATLLANRSVVAALSGFRHVPPPHERVFDEEDGRTCGSHVLPAPPKWSDEHSQMEGAGEILVDRATFDAVFSVIALVLSDSTSACLNRAWSLWR
jgi:hypothetical protein